MDEYAVLFLCKPWWNATIRAIGPTLTLWVLLRLRVHRWGNWLYARRRYTRHIDRIIGFRPGILAEHVFFLHLIFHYDREIVPDKARKLGLLLRAVRALLVAGRVKFIWNMASGTGHTTIELDHALRWQIGQKNVRTAFLCRPGPFFTGVVELYKSKFRFAADNHALYDLLFPLIAASPDLRFDCGQSRAKWQLKPDGSYDDPPPGQTYFYEIDKAENIAQRSRYFDWCKKTQDRTPLREEVGLDPLLRGFLVSNGIFKDSRIALIHIKYNMVNATAAPSDPAAYAPAIRWLHEQGYKTILVGREPYPPLFYELGVVNYSESRIASYTRDIQLFSMASVAITAGSGISFLPDCMGKPYLYLDSWHLAMAQPSKLCVNVPALLKDRKSGRVLSYDEQMRLYLGVSDSGGETFPVELYEGLNAEPEEILEALKEALDLARKDVPMSSAQMCFHDLLPPSLQPLARSRVSDFFLARHMDLLYPEESERLLKCK